MLAQHVSDLTGPSSGAFLTSCICRFGMWRILFKFNKELHGHNTRINTNLYSKNVRLTKVTKGPYTAGIRVFNHLQQNIKALLHNAQHFKRTVKMFFLHNPFYSMEDYFEYKDTITN